MNQSTLPIFPLSLFLCVLLKMSFSTFLTFFFCKFPINLFIEAKCVVLYEDLSQVTRCNLFPQKESVFLRESKHLIFPKKAQYFFLPQVKG